jgi:hypothetical protein
MPRSDRSSTVRKEALDHYPHRCVWCGFGISAVLEVAHLDGNRRHNALDNLALLCPTHHRMLDLDLLPEETVRDLRDRPRSARWSKLMGDGAQRAHATRKARREKRQAAAKKAVATRRSRNRDAAV